MSLYPTAWQVLHGKLQWLLLSFWKGAEGSHTELSIPQPCPLAWIPTMPHPQHPAPSIALYTHPTANLERADLVPASFKEGEIEACSLSSHRDSVRAPSMPHAPEISSAKWENPIVLGWEHAISIPLGRHPLPHLMPVHQAWHNSQVGPAGGKPASAPSIPTATTRLPHSPSFMPSAPNTRVW